MDSEFKKQSKNIDQQYFLFSDEIIAYRSPIKLKTISSSVTGSGIGLYQSFVNRHVNLNYNCSDHRKEMAEFLRKKGFNPDETVGMMTAVSLKDVEIESLLGDGFELIVAVTAGVGNAVDASLGMNHSNEMIQGTINIWIIADGTLTDEAFIQSIITATEAKAKALQKSNVKDRVNDTIATGTSTDSILVAATQKGKKLDYGGSITELGTLIGRGVFNCVNRGVSRWQQRNESHC